METNGDIEMDSFLTARNENFFVSEIDLQIIRHNGRETHEKKTRKIIILKWFKLTKIRFYRSWSNVLKKKKKLRGIVIPCSWRIRKRDFK